MRSMTGFAREQILTTYGQLVLELRSVNQRFLDIHFHLSESLRQLEPILRQHLTKRLWRGKLEITLRLRLNGQANQQHLNENQLNQLHHWSTTLKNYFPDLNAPTTIDILLWPGIMQETELDPNALEQQVLALLDQTLTKLIETRTREGQHLANALLERLQSIEQVLQQIKMVLPKITEQQHQQLINRATQLGFELEPQRLAIELALLVQKSDVSEEIDRLTGHIAEVYQQLNQEGAIGRRLDFLMQELNREANTLASKAADNRLTHAAVELKVLIEQMREQVQNIE